MLHTLRLGILLSAVVSLFVLSTAARAADEPFDEGIDYKVMDLPPMDTGGKVKVQEFFWYGCPHCFNLEPLIKPWVANLPEGVEFERVPAPLNKNWVIHARAYYAAQQLGVAEKGHSALFNAIHKEKQRLFDRQSLADFYGKLGADEAEFKKALGSFGVSTKVRTAALLTRRYQLSGVPEIIINGRYQLSAHDAGGNARMMKVADYLVKRELAARDSGTGK